MNWGEEHWGIRNAKRWKYWVYMRIQKRMIEKYWSIYQLISFFYRYKLNFFVKFFEGHEWNQREENAIEIVGRFLDDLLDSKLKISRTNLWNSLNQMKKFLFQWRIEWINQELNGWMKNWMDETFEHELMKVSSMKRTQVQIS